jgi:hypothetical protein
LDEADRLLAAVIYLMCAHARNGCPRLAGVIEKHLQAIGRHPDVSDRVRDVCRKLSASWVAIRQHDERAGARIPPDKRRLH